MGVPWLAPGSWFSSLVAPNNCGLRGVVHSRMVRYATAGCIQPNPNHGRIGRPTFCLPYPTTAPSGGGKDARWSMSVDLSAPPVRLANKLLVALLRAENETLAAFWPQCLFVRTSAGLRDLAQAGCMPALLQGATAMRRVAFQMPSHWFWSDGGKRTKHRITFLCQSSVRSSHGHRI